MQKTYIYFVYINIYLEIDSVFRISQAPILAQLEKKYIDIKISASNYTYG